MALIVSCFLTQPVVTSQLGTVNNIIQVRKTDFEVFDALMVDSQKCSDMSGECWTPAKPSENSIVSLNLILVTLLKATVMKPHGIMYHGLQEK